MILKTTCAFCSKSVEFDDESLTAAHEVPPCQTFIDAKDALEFAVSNRRAKGIPAAPEDQS